MNEDTEGLSVSMSVCLNVKKGWLCTPIHHEQQLQQQQRHHTTSQLLLSHLHCQHAEAVAIDLVPCVQH